MATSILKTSHRIVAACLEQLHSHPAVIVAYPLRRTNWVFYREAFGRRGTPCRCVSLIADIAHITARQRMLTPDEVERSAEMIAKGFGQRPFSDLILRNDESNFAETSDRLVREVDHFSG
ncbi:hypothetical protein [Chelativorans salis]|uniref:Uncharacterized protein n=1 Tax=Chelativorans salis TaxID=2978478 RepID=A0ABT2LXX8_9HYPH|nr:hypothetical protein [Chelativorans sp. EGI FJ00035]MCT7378049.1 hypothetical protein [Chelativorans sp. EGI FJ00035]